MNSTIKIMEQVVDWADEATPKNGREVFQFLIMLYWVGIICGSVFLLVANLW